MSLLIKGVQVVDGTGKEPYKADVLVQKNLISSIGSLKERGAGKVIEGLGNYLVPGFIDAQSHSDHYLSVFTNPKQEDYLRQGVTTVLGGADGYSLAPLLYGAPDSLNWWSDTSEINVNWHTIEEFLDQLEDRKLGLNFGTLVGHSTLRRDIVGSRKTIDTRELAVLKKVVRDALNEGAFGASIDLGSVDGSVVATKEVSEIAGAVAEGGGVYVIGLRDTQKGFLKSFEEVVKVAKSSGAKILIDNLRPFEGSAKDFREALKRLEDIPEERDIFFTLQPSTVSEIPIYQFLPASLKKQSLGSMLAKVREPKSQKSISEELKNLDLRSIKVASAPHHHFMVGKTVKEVAENWDVSYIEAMLKIMDMSDLRATVFYEDANRPTLRNYLGSGRAVITANATGVISGGGYLQNEHAEDIFPSYLRSAVREGLRSLEDAVSQITSLPAALFGIRGKGLIEEGTTADLVLLSKDKYEVKKVILAGRVFEEEDLRGEILRFYR